MSTKSKPKKGIKATLNKYTPPKVYSIHQMEKLSNAWLNREGVQDILNRHIAEIWAVKSQSERMKVAQHFLFTLEYLLKQVTDKNDLIVFVDVMDKAWQSYANAHEACAVIEGDSYWPTTNWVRQYYAQQPQIKKFIEIKDSNIIAGFFTRRWGHPIAHLHPDKYLRPNEDVFLITEPTEIQIIEDDEDEFMPIESHIKDDEDLQEELYQEHLEAQGIEADFNQLQAEQWERENG